MLIPELCITKDIQNVKNYVLGDIDTPFKSLFIPSALYMLEHLDAAELLDKTEDLIEWGSGKVQYLPNQIKTIYRWSYVFSKYGFKRWIY